MKTTWNFACNPIKVLSSDFLEISIRTDTIDYSLWIFSVMWSGSHQAKQKICEVKIFTMEDPSAKSEPTKLDVSVGVKIQNRAISPILQHFHSI